MVLANGARLCVHALLVVIVVVVLGALAAARVLTWALVLLVDAATTLDAAASWLLTISLAVVATIIASSLAIAIATLDDRLHGLLLRVEVVVENVHQLDLLFFLQLVELLDLLGHGVALSFVPQLLQGLKVMLGVGKQATESDGAAAGTKEKEQ